MIDLINASVITTRYLASSHAAVSARSTRSAQERRLSTQIPADVFAPQLPVPAQSTWTHTPVIVSAVDINSVTMATSGIQMSVGASARRISCIVGGIKLQTSHHVSVSVMQTLLAHLGRH